MENVELSVIEKKQLLRKSSHAEQGNISQRRIHAAHSRLENKENFLLRQGLSWDTAEAVEFLREEARSTGKPCLWRAASVLYRRKPLYTVSNGQLWQRESGM